MLIVPENLVQWTIQREGEAGATWIAKLPERVEALCQRWNLTLDGAPMHGGLSLVVPVRQGAEDLVLKVGWVDSTTRLEAIALNAWNGQGAVRLIDHLPDEGALLLERLDFRRSLGDVAVEAAIPIAGQLLRRLAVPAPPEIPRLQTIAEQLAETLPECWEQSGHPLSRSLLERACALARELGPTASDRLVNYDLIYLDVLAAEREPWLVVDPKVVAGDPEYGAAQLLWRRVEAMQTRGGLDRHFRILTECAALDPERTRLWTLVRCVDYWLWAVSVGLTYDPIRCEVLTNWLLQA